MILKVRTPALCIWLALNAGTVAAEISDVGDNRQQDLERVQEQLRATQSNRQEIDTQRTMLLDELATIEKEYGRIAQEIRDIDIRIRAQQRKVSELERRRDKTATSMERHLQALSQQTRAAYGTGHSAWIHLLLEQRDAASLGRVLAYYNYLERNRTARYAGAQQDLQSIATAESELRAENNRLSEMRRGAVDQRAQWVEVKKSRSNLLAKLNRDYTFANRELSRLEENERFLQGILSGLTSGESAEGPSPAGEPAEPAPLGRGGRTRCPVQGRVAQRYGNPRLSGKWDGMLITAAEGAPVRAVEGGRVEFADWLRGYGLLTIISHGNGLLSLYAFNQSLTKNVGDSVNAGDIIAIVGSSGGREKPGVYFGLRQDGNPIDPSVWCDPAG